MNSGFRVWISTITGHAASRTIFGDQFERVLGALAEPDERDVGPLPGGDLPNVCDLDLAHDHLVPQGRDDRRWALSGSGFSSGSLDRAAKLRGRDQIAMIHTSE